ERGSYNYMTPLLSTIISTVLGSVLIINGVALRTDDIIDQAKASVNSANVHQLATVMEIYYMDHNTYPAVSGGEALIDTLESEGYIKSRPLDPKVFNYEVTSGGEDYSLTLTK
ncbi:MAG: type II secretion system protein GspG, partial [Candidatus Taylorbacteria bacterium]|nr:type II secretion system protein GspG [Candidatus Taylorbacteria bacterium]